MGVMRLGVVAVEEWLAPRKVPGWRRTGHTRGGEPHVSWCPYYGALQCLCGRLGMICHRRPVHTSSLAVSCIRWRQCSAVCGVTTPRRPWELHA